MTRPSNTTTGIAASGMMLLCALFIWAPTAEAAKGGKGGGDQPTCDTFRNAASDNVLSDVLGDTYCDSEHHVSALIGAKWGGHHLDTERSVRTLFLDFGDCASAGGCGRGDTETTEAVLSIENGSREGGINLLEMPVDVWERVGIVIGFSTSRKNHWRLSFGRVSTIVACLDGNGDEDPGDKVRVKRVAQDSWVFESLAGERACLSEVRNNDWNDPVAHGHYEMPFELTVTFE